MWRAIPVLGAASLLLVSAALAQSLDTETIAKVAATTRSLCLSGSQYDLQVNADGSLSLIKLEPGGQGKIRITQSTGTGGALNYQDEGKRVEADKNIIGCISQNIPVLLTAAGARLAPPAENPQQQPLNRQQIQLISDTAVSICNAVKDAKGQKSDVQLQGDVKTQVGGLLGKVIGTSGSGKGSLTTEEFEGLSRDATATALEGERGCRERVFDRMFKIVEKQLSFDTEAAPHSLSGDAHVPGMPLAIAARLLKANSSEAHVNLLIRNTNEPPLAVHASPEIEFSFGPAKPKLIIWGIGELEASSTSPGVCSSVSYDSCKSLNDYLTLQAGRTLPTNLDFSLIPVSLTDVSVLTSDKTKISLSIRTADRGTSYVELPLAPH